ncbi:MAG: hypothetical protein H7Y30_02095 [Pyrinomonadaceae bacterium]|nr:hypothetical protein [Pyrinomonadaceae bacterium]
MKSNNLKNKIGGAILAFSIVLGVGFATSMTAQAQYRDDDRDDDQYQRNRDYEREKKRREREWRRQQRQRERSERNNDNGYGYGNDGYGYGNRRGRSSDGYGNYGGSFQLRQTALNAGANEGIKEGRRDRERGERFDYADEGAYQKATEDYSSRLGDRYTFQRYFREAFVTGYTEGYRGY